MEDLSASDLINNIVRLGVGTKSDCHVPFRVRCIYVSLMGMYSECQLILSIPYLRSIAIFQFMA